MGTLATTEMETRGAEVSSCRAAGEGRCGSANERGAPKADANAALVLPRAGLLASSIAAYATTETEKSKSPTDFRAKISAETPSKTAKAPDRSRADEARTLSRATARAAKAVRR